MTRTRSKEK